MKGGALLLCLALIGCNAVGLATSPSSPAPSPSRSPAVTLTPPSPCPTSSAPSVTTNSPDCGNADYALVIPDRFDSDGNAYTCLWLCTQEAGSPWHEELQDWDLSAGDGDGSVLLGPPTDFPCCSIWPGSPRPGLMP